MSTIVPAVRRIAPRAVAACLALVLAACGDDDETAAPQPTIAQAAAATADLSTLNAAIRAGGLDTALAGPGPFTVFAPGNAAFTALPAGTVEALVAPANRAVLQDLLRYHVVAGVLNAAQLRDGQTLTTLEGNVLTVRVQGGAVTVNGRRVTTPDVRASNGVVHVVDGVLTEGLDAVQRALVTPGLGTLVQAVTAANLGTALAAPGPITVFAPQNAAFAAVPADQLQRLLDPANRALLTKVLGYHVVPGRVLSTQLTEGQTVTTLEGSTARITLAGGARINGARIVTPDVVTSNGVVHVIDGVLTDNLDLVDVATVRGFSSLVGAVQAAGLTAALRGNGAGQGLTVFAPTNAAFAAIPGGAPSDPAVLAQVLQLHVVAGRAPAAGLRDGQTITTLGNRPLTVGIAGGTVSLRGARNAARVTATDVPARNGIIHVIDTVLLP